jgi:hypothetical protein
MPRADEISVFTNFSRLFVEWMRETMVFAGAVRIGSAMLVSSRSLRRSSARAVLGRIQGDVSLSCISYSGILALQPWFNEKGAEGEKGGDENDSASGVAPSRGLPDEPEENAKKDEKDSMNHSGEVNGFLLPLNPLHHDRAIEKHEV